MIPLLPFPLLCSVKEPLNGQWLQAPGISSGGVRELGLPCMNQLLQILIIWSIFTPVKAVGLEDQAFRSGLQSITLQLHHVQPISARLLA